MALVKSKSFYKWFFFLTFTIALRNVIVFTVNLADSVMLGKYSEEALSGVVLVNQIQFILQLMVIGVCEGAQIFISRAWGNKDEKAMQKIVSIMLKASLVVALFVMIIMALFPSEVLSLFSNNEDFVSEGVKYTKYVIFSYPFFAVSSALVISLNAVENTKVGFYTSLGTLFVNIISNYCLIYGKLGFPKMGVEGAAIATLISRIVECLAVVLYILLFDKRIKMRFKHLKGFDKKIFSEYVKKGLPVFMSNSLWGVAMSFQLAILGHMGKSAITANGISNTLFQIVTVITYASSSASAVIISKTIGEGRKELVKPYSKTLQLLFLGIGVVTGLVLFMSKDLIIGFYDVSESSRELALAFMAVLSVTVIGTSYECPCLNGLVRAGGDTSFVFKNDMIFMWLIVLPLSFVAAFVLELSPVWVFIILKSDQILKCFVAVVKVNRFKWLKTINI